VTALPNARFDRCHFHRFGPSSLDFEAVYYLLSPDYNAHMDAQQAVLLAIAHGFRERGVDFAFPTQTLHIAGESAMSVHPARTSAGDPHGPRSIAPRAEPPTPSIQRRPARAGAQDDRPR
jgi:small-conductance mechanosensitive channel